MAAETADPRPPGDLSPGNCLVPNSRETLDLVGMERAAGLAIGCESGPQSADAPEDEPRQTASADCHHLKTCLRILLHRARHVFLSWSSSRQDSTPPPDRNALEPMTKLWKAAIAVAGLGAVAFFCFYGLYSQWLTLPIFERITQTQTFVLMLTFLILTFASLAIGLYAYLKSAPNQPVQADLAPSNSRDVVLFELGGDLRRLSLVQSAMGSDSDAQARHTRRLAQTARLRPHSKESGDQVVSFYYEQLPDPTDRCLFDIGFVLAQIATGSLIYGRADSATRAFVLEELNKCRQDLKSKLTRFNLAHLLEGFPEIPSEGEISLLHSSIAREFGNKTAPAR